MKKIIFIFLLVALSNCAFSQLNLGPPPRPLTPQDMGSFDLGQALQSGVQNYSKFQEAQYTQRNLEAALLAQNLQNKMLEIKLSSQLAAHPEVAKDMAEKARLNKIVAKNSGLRGLFRSRNTYISELKNCANQGNKYCKNVLNNEQAKQQR